LDFPIHLKQQTTLVCIVSDVIVALTDYSFSKYVPAIPFIDLGNSGGTLTGVLDGASPVINLPSPLPIGESNVTTAYVSINLLVHPGGSSKKICRHQATLVGGWGKAILQKRAFCAKFSQDIFPSSFLALCQFL